MKSKEMIDQIVEMRRQKHTILKISQSLGISRNTVKKYLRQLESPAALVSPACNNWYDSFDWAKVAKARQSGVTAQQLYREYAPPASYSRFCRHLKKHLCASPKPALKLDHIAGERCQVDYADGVALIDRKSGSRIKTQLFCGVLPFSSYTFAEFTMSQKLDSFIRSHERMFAFFGGVPPYVVLDNLKSGVKKAHRYDPELNPTYCDFANKTGFAGLAARPYTPRDKACVEATIGAIQRSFYQEVREEKFYSLAELNARFRVFLYGFNRAQMKDYGISRLDRFANEKDLLASANSEPYEIAEWKTAKVHPDSCIQAFKALYSVPFRYIGQSVRVKATPKLLEVFDRDTNPIACHAKQPSYGQSIKDEHLPPTHTQQSRYDVKKCIYEAEKIGPNTHALITGLLGGSRPLRYLRRAQGILRLQKQGITNEALEYAASTAQTFSRLELFYIKSCAHNFMQSGGRLRSVSAAPKRDLDSTHLHGG